MSLLSGLNHVAILTADLDRWLHPVEAANSPHATAIPAMLERGHLDHIALTAASSAAFEVLRSRLVERGASNGVVDDLGAFHTVWFEDPDGMRGELTLVVDEPVERDGKKIAQRAEIRMNYALPK